MWRRSRWFHASVFPLPGKPGLGCGCFNTGTPIVEQLLCYDCPVGRTGKTVLFPLFPPACECRQIRQRLQFDFPSKPLASSFGDTRGPGTGHCYLTPVYTHRTLGPRPDYPIPAHTPRGRPFGKGGKPHRSPCFHCARQRTTSESDCQTVFTTIR